MIRRFIPKLLVVASAIAVLLMGLSGAIPASAQQANVLGVFNNWSAFTAGSGSNLTCYAMSKPRATTPKTASRGAIFLIVTDYPARRVKAEAEIVPGYAYKDNEVVSLGVGSEKFAFFGRTDSAKAGAAWIKNLGDNNALIKAMSEGVSAVAIGKSARGTRTVDTYSLAGFNDALAKIHDACNM